MARPLLIGLTGSIGMGKSETAKMFARLGIPVNDSDVNVHAVYEPGGAAVPEIEKAFPGTVRDGRVDRALLSKALAADPSGFKRLETIVHPLVAKVQQAFLARVTADGADMVVLDVPLLFETGGHARMDAVVVVSAPSHIQRARVLERPGMTEDKLDQILSRQMPDEEKRAKAHYVVVTDKGLDHAFEQVQMIVKDLRAKIAAGQMPET
ncbi:MAG: dephospho-CoA kinase [Proteobacteria bacterium]|nr:dephospho-CoA kinase [Pseudomonadota bacterium]